MDSRGIKNAVLIALCMMIVIVLAVIMGNWNDIQKKFGKQFWTEDSLSTEENAASVDESKQIGSDLSAFLQDEKFFDKDTEGSKGVTISYGRTASMFMTSVERDLRIHIVDVAGNLITDEEFEVTLEDVGTYKDSDKDGIIYIKPLKSGEYHVVLHQKEDYRISEEPAVISVKQKVEYVAISDIDLLILTEDDVDAAKEDGEILSEAVEGDDTENTSLTASNRNAKLGIDVSKWNKEIDWDKVKDAGVEFAIIRVGYRGYTSGSLIEDPYFEANIKGASKAGINIGVYFFSQAITTVEAVEEASMVISLCEKYHLTYPVFIDSESSGGSGRADNLSAAARTDISVAFMETIESAGYDAGIYAARNWINNRLEADALSNYIVWLAEYRDVPLYQGYYDMWQYTSKGKIDGINGNVDLNISYLK